MNKPLPRLPGTPIDTFRKKRNSQIRRAWVEDDDNERRHDPISPLFAMRNKNTVRRREFIDLPLQNVSTSKPILTAPSSHYAGDTPRANTLSAQNRGLRGLEQEVTLGLDQSSLRTPTRTSRSVTSRTRLNVDAIPQEYSKLRYHSLPPYVYH